MADALRLSRDTDIEALAESVESRDNFPCFVGTGTQPIYWKRTDLGIVQEFLDRHRDKLRRVVDIALSDRDGFAWWCGTHWVIGVDAKRYIWGEYFALVEEARNATRAIYNKIKVEQRKKTENEVDFIAFTKSLESAGGGRNFLTVLGLAEAETLWVKIGDFDQDIMLLNFRNGTVDLRTGQLMPHDPAKFITKLIPIDYDPNADQSLWRKFLERIQPTERIDFLQRWAGYSATGSTKEKKFLVALGMSNTGKSVFWNAIAGALGQDYAITSSVETFEDTKRSPQGPSEDLAALRGVRLVILPEPHEGYKLSDALIKRATGGDDIRARRMRENGFTFTPQFSLVYYTNCAIRFDGGDSGMQTRYCECSFDVVIPKEEQDNSLKDQFAGEYRAGILAWIVQGAVAWYKDGLGIPESVRASTGARIESQDAIGQFISTYFETGDEGLREPVANVYALYLYDAEEQGTRFPMSKRALAQKLDDRGYPSQKVGNQMYRLRLSIKEECRPLLQTDAGGRYDRYR